MSTYKRKLIEVALPLEVINREAVREKSIRHGHPSTLHLWWARRPLSACRAVLFAQLVNDPSSEPEKFPTEELQAIERERLFGIIEKLVVWENINDKKILKEAYDEIFKSTDGNPPQIYDPFAGGGTIPLEGQRLGLKSRATDLNPVSVLINKALIEVPALIMGNEPISEESQNSQLVSWTGHLGLAEDIRNYGRWLQSEAFSRVGNLYPRAKLSSGGEANIIAWLWTRTVTCPNPACGLDMPLVRSFSLSTKPKRQAWVRPSLLNGKIDYEIVTNQGPPTISGTIDRTGATCVICKTSVPLSYIREFGRTHGLGNSLLCTVIDSDAGRTFLKATEDQILTAQVGRPQNVPEEPLPENPRDFATPNYGLKLFSQLFTNRQLHALMAFVELIPLVKEKVYKDAKRRNFSDADAEAYAKAISLYLAFGISRMTNSFNALNRWESSREQSLTLFSRQSVSMVWDFAETSPFSGAAGDYVVSIDNLAKAIEKLPIGLVGKVSQLNAEDLVIEKDEVVSTDPPYYDNIVYADLSDFFYIWLRKSLHDIFPVETATVLTPKTEELVAIKYRFEGNQSKANLRFQEGFLNTFTRIRNGHRPEIPTTIFYAFKQSEESEAGTSSTGWETMLSGLIEAGLTITATWPIRTELSNRMIGSGTNALASSIVLSCRPREISAETVNRRTFMTTLKDELPQALRNLQQGSIAPVDLAQAAIGPGMSVFSRFTKVLEADGSEMTVKTALALINQVLAEILSSQEGDFDPETRFCIKWFEQYEWNESTSGEADVLTRAVNTSLTVLERGGIFKAAAGKAKLIEPKAMSIDWDPRIDKNISIWEVALRIAHTVSTEGIESAAALAKIASEKVDMEAVKELSYLLFSICEKKNWSESGLLFNALGTAWTDFRSYRSPDSQNGVSQAELDLD